MENISTDYLGKHKKFRMNSKKLATAFLVSAFVVSVIVFWWLKLVGITITGEAFCGLEEHSHNEECYSSEVICGFIEEEKVTPSDVGQAHTHGENCYDRKLYCELSEHIHTSECFPDKTADVETVSDWLSTIEDVEITNNIPENLVAIAMSQVGYEESKNNFEYDSEGNRNGYTRYGEWYGNPYGKWNTMFLSFCLHYSNINNADKLKSAGAEAMRLAWQERGVYSSVGEYSPERGDIVFIDDDADGIPDSVAVVLSNEQTSLVVISGDSNDKVESKSFDVTDAVIGYGRSGALSFAEDMQYEEVNEEITEVTEEATEETSEEVSEENLPQTQEPPVNGSEALTMSENTDANITYINDLTSVLKAVTIKTTTGDIISNDSTVYLGQSYVVMMEFAEKNTGSEWIQFRHDENHELHYQIPENIHCEPFTEWHPITAETENGTIEDVGRYFVDGDGRLTVIFDDDPETGECFGAKYSNVDFTIEFNATVGSSVDGSSTEVDFNDEIKVKFNIDTTAAMVVSKTHGFYNSKDNTMEYTIKVEATKAVIKDLVVYDDIYADNKHHALKDTIVVTDLDGNVLDPQPTIGDGRYSNTFGFTLTDFPDFAAGEGFLITYKAALNDDVLGNDSVGLWNGVYPEGKDINGNVIKAADDDWVEVELNKIEKGGKQAVLEGANGEVVPVIEWEIEIKKGETDLYGTVVVDTLGEGLEYYTGKNILVKHYDQNGNKHESEISWDKVEIDGNTMSFALPEGYRFVIVYYTTYEELQEGEHKQYTNTAKVTIDLEEEVAGSTADVVGFIPRISKSARGDDGEYVYFTIEADVPAVIKDWGGFVLSDLAAFWGYNENSVGYLYVENIPEDMVITAVTKKSGRTVNFTPYVPGGPTENTFILVAPGNGDLHHSFNVYFNTSSADATSSKWILDEDALLTITYKIPFDAKTGTEWTGELQGDKTVEDVLLENYKLANEAYLNYTDIIEATGSTTYGYSPKITKNSVISDDGVIDYKVVFNNTIPGSGGNQGYINGTTDPVWFTDTFDERLEYVPGSLIVTTYSPWNESLWTMQYKYNGTFTGNTINADSKDFIFYDYNEEADASGWNWINSAKNFKDYYSWVGAGGKFVFTYKLQVKDEYLYTTEHNQFELDNTAELFWGTDNSSGPVTDTSVFETGLLDKHVVQENNKLYFDIHVNRRALDILEGSETLTIEDTMTANLSVYWDSIKLYYEDDNGNWIDFDSDQSGYEYTVTYDQPSNKLTFVIPDELHIRIDYTTLITESGLVSVDNAVKIDGKAQVSDVIDAIFKVEQHSGGASGSIHNITLLKQDGDSDMPLPDVEFLLYGPMGNPDAVVPSGADAYVVADSGTRLYFIGAYETGVDGTVNIETQYLTFGGPYALVEVSPPTGYNPLEKPVYFYFYEPDPNGIIQTVTTLIAVENYTYSFVLPETGGTGTLPLAIIGVALTAFPILYSTIRRKRERRLT